MSIFEKTLNKEGVPHDRGVPDHQHLGKRKFAKIINAVRAAEIDMEESREADRLTISDLQKQLAKLGAKYESALERCHQLERREEQSGFKRRMAELELPRSDQQFLLTGETV